jgi:hypothetical protein
MLKPAVFGRAYENILLTPDVKEYRIRVESEDDVDNQIRAEIGSMHVFCIEITSWTDDSGVLTTGVEVHRVLCSRCVRLWMNGRSRHRESERTDQSGSCICQLTDVIQRSLASDKQQDSIITSTDDSHTTTLQSEYTGPSRPVLPHS